MYSQNYYKEKYHKYKIKYLELNNNFIGSGKLSSILEFKR